MSSFGADSGRTTSAGWRSKVTHTAVEPARVGELAHQAEHRVVAEVHAVVHADGDDRAPTPGRTGERVESAVRSSTIRTAQDPVDHDGGPQRRAAPLVDREQGAVGTDERVRTVAAHDRARRTRTTPRG